MEIQLEIAVACALLVALAFLATIDMAFGQLSDVGLRRLMAEREERPTPTGVFLCKVLEDRPRFRFTLNATIQVLPVAVVVLATTIWFQALGAVRRVRPFASVFAPGLTSTWRQVVPRLPPPVTPQ